MAKPTVIGLGEFLWDVFPDSRRPGGAPANVAYHVNQLGGHGRVASRVGTDPDGEELIEFLHKKQLDTQLIQHDPDHPTGRVTVQLSETGQPGYTIHQSVAWEFLQPVDELLNACRNADAITWGTLAQRTTVSRKTIHECLNSTREDCLTLFDVNLRQQWYDRDTIECSLQRASIVKLNTDEWPTLSALLEWGTLSVPEFAARMRKQFGVSVVCITRGSEGCILLEEAGTYELTAKPVTVVDTVGAGDAFAAALMVSLLHGQPLEQAGRFANDIGGLVASRPGAMPDILEDAKPFWS